MSHGEVVELMNGKGVPKVCLDALEEFDMSWPGASFVNARPGLVAAVLNAIGYFDSVQIDGGLYEMVFSRYVVENYVDVTQPITPDFFRERWAEMTDEEKSALIERAKKGAR
jgi:hypothetical protein